MVLYRLGPGVMCELLVKFAKECFEEEFSPCLQRCFAERCWVFSVRAAFLQVFMGSGSALPLGVLSSNAVEVSLFECVQSLRRQQNVGKPLGHDY